MTNTIEFPSPAAKLAYRTDELGMRADVDSATRRQYRILQVGRFVPGNEACYAGIEVLRWDSPDAVQQFVVHTLLRIDDYEEVRFELYAGHYFSKLQGALDYLNR